MPRITAAIFLVVSTLAAGYRNEVVKMPDHTVMEDYISPLPHHYLKGTQLPENFTWANVDGVSYLTKNLNQHIPNYCGSCWAHGALSSLGDRIKIARKARGPEINLSIQYILNCGRLVAGSCHGGTATGVYEFIKRKSGHVPYDTCAPYQACSSESKEGYCPHVDTQCTAGNTCKTCGTFGQPCREIHHYPNASIAEYGTVTGEENIMAEVYARGPVACGINAEPILNYEGGAMVDRKAAHKLVNHIVSIVGWGTDAVTGVKYWQIRNSWGEYWGESGFMRLERGYNSLGIEGDCAWATLKDFTETNVPCWEGGENCNDEYRAKMALKGEMPILGAAVSRRQSTH